MNERALKRDGLDYEKVHVHPASHAAYYPGAAPISLKLLFDPGNGRILGAQAVGAEGWTNGLTSLLWRCGQV
ncbi:MAG: hypothetical protein L0Y36_06430 [Planctomycetales bacterium]|nr:hypothetical protein [Planctomycetales bacterium]